MHFVFVNSQRIGANFSSNRLKIAQTDSPPPPWPISAVFRIRKANNLTQHIVIQWIKYNKTVYEVRSK